MLRHLSITWLVCILWVPGLVAGERFKFPEGKHGKGELRYVNGVPVLVLAGTPEEMGEQMGVLALKPARESISLLEELLKQEGLSQLRPFLAKFGDQLLSRCPEEYRRELDAAAKASGVDRDLLLIANTFHDVRKAFGCAALMVPPEHSATGGALMGRNLDYPLVKGMHEYSMVIVYRPAGKKPFAVVSFPGALLTGCAMSAMNADGLVIGQNDVYWAADGSPAVNLKNTPSAVLARRILEGCSTIPEAEKVLQKDKPASRSIFVVCDRKGGAAIEVTPKTVVLRRGANGFCVATNHFQCKELCVVNECRRASILEGATKVEKLGVADVAKNLHEVHQRAWTTHAIVFEPAALKIHVAFGDGDRPATAFPMKEIDLSQLLKP